MTEPEPARMHGPIERLLTEDHERLDALLARSTADPERFDHDAFEAFRTGLMRHIAIEEKVVFREVRQRSGGTPPPVVRTLRVEHGALASLLVPTPDHALVAELRRLLARHNVREEGPAGLYALCDRLAADEAESLCERARAIPQVPAAAHCDKPGVYRQAAPALWSSRRARRK